MKRTKSNTFFLSSKDLIRNQRIIDPFLSFLFSYLIYHDSIMYSRLDFFFYLINCLAAIVVFDLFQIYKSFRYPSLGFIFMRLFLAFLVSSSISLVLSKIMFDFFFVIDSKLGSLYLAYFSSLFSFHIIGRFFIRYYRQSKNIGINVLYWGDFESAKFLIENIDKFRFQGYKIKAWFSSEDVSTKKNLQKMNYIKGDLSSLRDWISKNPIDLIIFSDDITCKISNTDLIKFFGDICTKISYMPSWYKSSIPLNINYIGGIGVFDIWASELSGLKKTYKRCFDIVLSSIILLIFSPIFIIVSLAILWETRGPILFKQSRWGLDGKKFNCLKFRSMKVAESGDDQFLKQAIKFDPRVTKVGKFIRKWSIDELPQFLNVLMGDMSIVGPRPHPVVLNEKYRKEIPGYMQRHLLKPGITGLAQIKGYRGETKLLKEMEDRIEADLEYQREWNIFTDFFIVFKTIFTIKSDKAY